MKRNRDANDDESREEASYRKTAMYTVDSTVHKYLSNEEGDDREHRPLKQIDSSTS